MSTPAPDAARRPTAVDRVADEYLDRQAALDPVYATFAGIAGHDHALPDLSPDGLAAVAELRRATLAALAATEAVDDTDRVTAAALRDLLETEDDLRAIRADSARLNNIDSPLQFVRDVFDLMPTATVDDWATIAARLAAVPDALGGYVASLRDAAVAGTVPPVRQVRIGVEQCADNVGDDGFFVSLAAQATDADVPDSVRGDLDRAARQAGEAYERLAAFLRDELLPAAPERDPVGRERYAVHSRAFLGTRLDLAETYEWGQAEVARIEAEMAATAERIVPGGSVADAIAHLDASPAHRLAGTEELQRWMQRTSDEAVAALADVHFDIPEPIRRIECLIAPTQQGGIYYTGPSEDLTTRPGRMWWSVPKGVDDFGTWRERTTVYHEGVPGHHLQVAQTVYRAALLNRWRRLGSWVSGHGEGWALYAERLMADLGFLDDPADHLGMLDGQSLRAARVVLDIGIHCELPAPAEVGGGAWDYDKAWRFLTAHANTAEGFRRFELDRYLGWPGQAPSYKIGERFWLQLRDDARAAAGDAFDVKAFHRGALDVGSVGLDVLRAAVLGTL
ncbi:Uncharacterized conserved protein, DUF885 familyt [Jatrophihabitans endophyticus]|uniref:Uncharacterized conserved protein, DUF885 familyt n=1 Tax=Jatrophihabitans endophyticus TaxID=1206085 RepID=A0A1M5GBX1_9ACTN|nr:DUF885 domain-containing protein [Jatrophihabitans endophyticus]SHG01247.1 Uncharacterized conserved protein, DUF885 familyt [Jatrophihabitans endophyticus]